MKKVTNIKSLITTTLVLLFSATMLLAQNNQNSKIMSDQKSSKFYELSATSIDGEEINMNEYKDKVVLVVNTASKCGFTPQYAGLEELHDKYADKGLVVLGFPSNQFANQEPGTDDEIATFCERNYGVSFQMFSKVDVNGKNTHPVYKFLKDQKGGTFGSKIKWNFTKFLLDREGNVVGRFGSSTKPESLEDDIVGLLGE